MAQASEQGAARLDAALCYAARGWPVLALHTVLQDGSCTCNGRARCSAGKHPRWNRGLNEATLDPDRIRAWGRRWEQSNIGIRTGAVSGLVVLDIDPRHGGDQTLQSLEQIHGPLEHTVECLTGGGGRHLYFAHPGGKVPNSSGRLGPGLDVRGDGGYVVAPPSIHPRGYYQWKVSPKDVAELAPTPSWLLKQMCTRPNASMKDVINEGERNDRLFSLAGALHRQGVEGELIETILQTVNARCCRPPLPTHELGEIARSIQRYRRSAKKMQNAKNVATALVTRLSDVKPAEIHWLWPGRIPLGKLTLMAGDPGLGKSLVTLDMAARVSKGNDWPDTPTQLKAGGVALLAAEDDLADTVRPRMDKVGADLGRVRVLTAVRTHTATRPLNLAEDLEHLHTALSATPDTHLVIIDPVTAYLGDAETKSNTEIRAILAPLAAMAAELQVAVVAVTHLRKSGGKAIYRAMGSLAFAAAARAVWGVAKDPDQHTRQLFVPVKMNIGPQPTTIAYSIEDGPVVVWDATPLHADADGVLGQCGVHSAVEKAQDFLASKLAAGPRPVRQIEAEARDAGISKASLKRSRRRLRIRARKDASGRWQLSLMRNASNKHSPTNPMKQKQMELPFPDADL